MTLHPRQWREVLRLGMTGADVAAWQEVLSSDKPITHLILDGDFGARTHNLTVSWQSERGLTADGIVGPKTRSAIHQFPVRWRTDLGSLPYVEAANWSRHLGDQKKQVIVLHCMEAPEASTTARNVADWFAGKRGKAPRSSAHYCVDDRNVICCVPPRRVAWHAPGANRLGIGIEHAGFARQTEREWFDYFSRRMLHLSAVLGAQLCRQFAIPPRVLLAEELRDDPDVRGITTHAEVSKAFGRSDHSDPGSAFPMNYYLALLAEGLG